VRKWCLTQSISTSSGVPRRLTLPAADEGP
jgi:hypothetical protein